jgi:hypothetical protein
LEESEKLQIASTNKIEKRDAMELTGLKKDIQKLKTQKMELMQTTSTGHSPDVSKMEAKIAQSLKQSLAASKEKLDILQNEVEKKKEVILGIENDIAGIQQANGMWARMQNEKLCENCLK